MTKTIHVVLEARDVFGQVLEEKRLPSLRIEGDDFEGLSAHKRGAITVGTSRREFSYRVDLGLPDGAVVHVPVVVGREADGWPGLAITNPSPDGVPRTVIL